ncbi:Poly(U)-specific endoribonuclease-like protein [Diplonema papillatum]|nr:Poly(U)-specific endoribonuclease-like protein [Diplonema papillatum]
MSWASSVASWAGAKIAGTDEGALPAVEGLDVRAAIEALWDLDENRLKSGTDFSLDLQGYTFYKNKGDNARHPLFKHVDDSVFTDRPTYSSFVALLDNYEREVADAEEETHEERQEIHAFLDAILETPAMKFCAKYLAHQSVAPKDPSAFRRMLHTLWFRGYPSTSGGPVDSSGFEHVFVGEEKGSSITGMHNWVQLYREEAKGLLDYNGYISHDRSKPEDYILTLQFEWTDAEDGSRQRKPMSTSFIGVSPEFEIALYTLAALAPAHDRAVKENRGKREILCSMDELDVELNIVVWNRGRTKMLRTAYPEERKGDRPAKKSTIVTPADTLPAVEGLNIRGAIEWVWDLDDNRLTPGVDFILDLQGYTFYKSKGDFARHPLFKHVDDSVFTDRPTYRTFVALLDNYEREVADAEEETHEERQETQAFLDAVLATRPMQFCAKYLANCHAAPADPAAFRRMLHALWFRGYASTKGGPVDSSGFEHVFVGEEKGSSITGMHNWVQLYREEAKGLLDYNGYISHDRSKPEDHILTLQFEWTDAEDGSNQTKPMSTSFVGVSPEFEIALYTLAALAPDNDPAIRENRGKREILCSMDELDLELNSIVWNRGRTKMIRTAYPEERR